MNQVYVFWKLSQNANLFFNLLITLIIFIGLTIEFILFSVGFILKIKLKVNF